MQRVYIARLYPDRPFDMPDVYLFTRHIGYRCSQFIHRYIARPPAATKKIHREDAKAAKFYKSSRSLIFLRALRFFAVPNDLRAQGKC